MLWPSSYHAHAAGSKPGTVGSGAGQSSMARGGGGAEVDLRRTDARRGRSRGRCGGAASLEGSGPPRRDGGGEDWGAAAEEEMGEQRWMRVMGVAEDMGAGASDEIRLPRYPSRVLLESYRVR